MVLQYLEDQINAVTFKYLGVCMVETVDILSIQAKESLIGFKDIASNFDRLPL